MRHSIQRKDQPFTFLYGSSPPFFFSIHHLARSILTPFSSPFHLHSILNQAVVHLSPLIPSAFSRCCHPPENGSHFFPLQLNQSTDHHLVYLRPLHFISSLGKLLIWFLIPHQSQFLHQIAKSSGRGQREAESSGLYTGFFFLNPCVLINYSPWLILCSWLLCPCVSRLSWFEEILDVVCMLWGWYFHL